MPDYGTLWVAKEGGSFDIDGQPVILNPGDVVEQGHAVLDGRQHMFKPFEVRFANPRPAPNTDDDENDDDSKQRARTPRTRSG